jgi:hypothetical protein
VWLSNGTRRAKPGSIFASTAATCPKRFRFFDDPYAITIPDDESDPDEQRFVTLGMGATGRSLVVVYTWRGENIRIVSARPTEAREREQYEVER